MTRRRDLRFGSVLIISLGLYGIFLCPHLFLKGQVPVNGEIMRFVYPNWRFSRHMFRSFRMPFWNPYRDMGEPFLADPRSMSLYPVYWLILPFARFIDFLRVWFLSHALLAAYFAHRILRQAKASPAASLTAAALTGFGGFFIGHAFYPNQFASAAFAPVIMYGLISRKPYGLAAALALQWLAGYPPFFLLTLLAAALVSFVVDRAAVRMLIFAIVAALGLTTVQWVPFLELLRLSLRPAILPASQALDFSVPPLQLLKMMFVPQWVWFKPFLAGDPAMMNFYAGPVATGLAVYAIWRGSPRVRLIALGLLVSGLFAMGGYLPGYAAMRFLHVFRFPASWLLLTSVAIAYLAGQGVTLLPRKTWQWAACGLVLLDLAVFHQAIQVAWFPPAFLDEPPAKLHAVLDPSHAGRFFVPDTVSKAWLKTPLNNQSDFEFFKDSLVPSYPTAFGVREVDSYQILQTKRWGDFTRRLQKEGPRSPLRRWAGISAACELGRENARVTPTSLHFLRFGDRVSPLYWASSGTADRIEIQKYEPGLVEASVISPEGRDPIVFWEMFYPGWKALMDGQKTTLNPFQDAFLSVDVPTGTHYVSFRYQPLSFRIGVGISLMTLLILVIRRQLGRSVTYSFEQ